MPLGAAPDAGLGINVGTAPELPRFVQLARARSIPLRRPLHQFGEVLEAWRPHLLKGAAS